MKRIRKIRCWEDLETLLVNLNHYKYTLVLNGYIKQVYDDKSTGLNSIFFKIVDVDKLKHILCEDNGNKTKS